MSEKLLKEAIRLAVNEALPAKMKPRAIVATVSPEAVDTWAVAARQAKIKGMLKFEPAEDGRTNIVFVGYSTPSETRRTAERFAKQLKKIVATTSEEESALGPLNDDNVYGLLSHVFTVTVTPEDVQHIRYQVTPKAIHLEDVDGMLGHMDTGASRDQLKRDGLTPATLGAWLKAHGARPMKPVRSRAPSGPMGGYD